MVLNLGDGALGYSSIGFWTMARYNTAILTVVSANDSYQIVRHNWAKDMPDAKMIRDGKYPGLWLSDPAVDYVSLARSQGVDGGVREDGEGSGARPAARTRHHHARQSAVRGRGRGGARGRRRRLHLVPGLEAVNPRLDRQEGTR